MQCPQCGVTYPDAGAWLAAPGDIGLCNTCGGSDAGPHPRDRHSKSHADGARCVRPCRSAPAGDARYALVLSHTCRRARQSTQAGGRMRDFDTTGNLTRPYAGPGSVPERCPPAAYMPMADVFTQHYRWHLQRNREAGRKPTRPTLGQLHMTSKIAYTTCRRLRRDYERETQCNT